jgi:flagellar basal body-associated protein FliL
MRTLVLETSKTTLEKKTGTDNGFPLIPIILGIIILLIVISVILFFLLRKKKALNNVSNETNEEIGSEIPKNEEPDTNETQQTKSQEIKEPFVENEGNSQDLVNEFTEKPEIENMESLISDLNFEDNASNEQNK